VLRKLDLGEGRVVRGAIAQARAVGDALRSAGGELAGLADPLAEHLDKVEQATEHLLGQERNERLAASSTYLRLLGSGICASLLARLALAARDDETRASRTQIAGYFCEHILPVEGGRLRSVLAGDRYFAASVLTA
jgi:hypothetical protein